MKIAALYVETGGSYFSLPGVDPWDEQRDARKYAGPWPVVAHPPCQRWGSIEQGQYGHYARKPTLLYVCGVEHQHLPSLRWGFRYADLDPAIVERMGIQRAKRLGEVAARGGGTDSAPRIGTPTPFRDLLISMALSAGFAEAAE